MDIDDFNDIYEEIRREFARQMKLWRKTLNRARKRLGFNFEYEVPAADVVDKGDKYLVEIDLPGVDKNDINVTLVDHHLKIMASRKVEKEEKDENYILSERVFSGYKRIIPLPEDADENSIKAKYENGVLRIEIGKKPGYEGKKINLE
jgi:HSP20 family protein